MGKILFRRIGGRIVPILTRGNEAHILPAKVGQVVENIRFMRDARAIAPSPKGFAARFLMEHETNYMKIFGKRTAATIAAMLKAKKGK